MGCVKTASHAGHAFTGHRPHVLVKPEKKSCRAAMPRPASPLPLRAVVKTSGHLTQELPAVAVHPADDPGAPAVVSVPTAGVDLQALERALILFALDISRGNRTRAARFLGLTRSALCYRIRKYGLGTAASADRTH